MVEIVPKFAGFCGNVPDTNQGCDVSNVSPWWMDVESRILTQRITSEASKMKNAHALVSDGHARMKLFQEFKEECLSSWGRFNEVDALVNFYKSRKNQRDSVFLSFVNHIYQSMEQNSKGKMSSGTIKSKILEENQKSNVRLQGKEQVAQGLPSQRWYNNKNKSSKKRTDLDGRRDCIRGRGWGPPPPDKSECWSGTNQ